MRKFTQENCLSCCLLKKKSQLPHPPTIKRLECTLNVAIYNIVIRKSTATLNKGIRSL